MLVSAIWSLLPWYGWLALVLSAVVATYLGLWPLLIGFAKRVPRGAWEVLGAFVVAAIVHTLLLNAAVDRAVSGTKAEDAKHEATALESQRLAFQKQLQDSHDAAQGQLDDLGGRLVNAQLERQASADAAEADRVNQLAALKKRLANYVSPLQLSRCPDLPRGFLRFATDAAAYANGRSDVPTVPSAAELDAPSGISIPAYADTISDQAGAYRACRNRVTEWEKYGRDVDAYFDELTKIFHHKGAIPK